MSGEHRTVSLKYVIQHVLHLEQLECSSKVITDNMSDGDCFSFNENLLKNNRNFIES